MPSFGQNIIFGILLAFCLSFNFWTVSKADSLHEMVEKHDRLKTPESLQPILKLALEGVKKAQEGKHTAEQANAIFYLAHQYYFGHGTKVDKEIAFQFLSVITWQERTHLRAAHDLASYFLLDADSEHFDLSQGIRVLRLLAQGGRLDSQLLLAYNLNKFRDQLPNNSSIDAEIESVFELAAKQGSPGAHLNLYLIKEEKFSQKPELVGSAIENLRFAAENTWSPKYHSYSLQAAAARNLAAIYYRGKLIPESLSDYRKYLKIAADLDDKESLYLLGKAYMFGTGGAVDYAAAEAVLLKARDLGVKSAQLLIDRIKDRIKLENDFVNYEPPTSIFETFVASQAYFDTGSLKEKFELKNGYYSPIDSNNNSQTSTYRFSGSQIYGPDGTSWKISGDTIRGSNGVTYKRNGSKIRSSNGINYNISGNTLRGSDGTRYKFSGNTIRGSNGVICRRTGQTLRCF